MTSKQCVNCPGATDHTTAECPLVGGERAAFEAAFEGEFFSSCFEREDDGTYAGRGLQGAWMGWQKARAILPVGVPEGWKLVPVEPTQDMIFAFIECDGDLREQYRAMLAAAPAAPTVKAEQVDCLYCQGHGDVTRIFGQTAESYSEHNEECPECSGTGLATALPVAGVEEPDVAAWMWRDLNGDMQFNYMHPEGQELMTVAQHNRIVAALSAQQAGAVSVDQWTAIEAAIMAAFEDGKNDYKGCTRERIRELRALLSSSERGDL